MVLVFRRTPTHDDWRHPCILNIVLQPVRREGEGRINMAERRENGRKACGQARQ